MILRLVNNFTLLQFINERSNYFFREALNSDEFQLYPVFHIAFPNKLKIITDLTYLPKTSILKY